MNDGGPNDEKDEYDSLYGIYYKITTFYLYVFLFVSDNLQNGWTGLLKFGLSILFKST